MPEITCFLCGFVSGEKNSLKEKFNLFQCKKCQFMFIFPRPSEKESKEVYKDFSSGIKKLSLKEAKKICYPFKKAIGKNYPESKKILEIGCSEGYILYGLRAYGYRVVGTDLSLDSCRFAKSYYDIEVYNSEFPPNELEHFFDVLIISQLIEHLREPKEFLNKASKFLAKDGILIISTPNSDALGFKVFKNCWPVVSPPFHINFFNRKSLSFLLKDKFQILEIKTQSTDSFCRNPFFYNFLKAITAILKKKTCPIEFKKSDLIGSNSQMRRGIRKFLQFLFSPFFFIFDKMGVGEYVNMVVRKIN